VTKSSLLVSLVLALSASPAAAAVTEQQGVYAYIQQVTSKKVADRFSAPILVASRRHHVPPLLVAKVVHRESDFDPRCVTDTCVGLMQVDPRFWARAGESMFAVADNLEAGCRLLEYLHGKFPDWKQALTAYNYGEFHPVTRRIKTSSYAVLVLAGR
jgi:soluble lytic murein transglycosylase-like protein